MNLIRNINKLIPLRTLSVPLRTFSSTKRIVLIPSQFSLQKRLLTIENEPKIEIKKPVATPHTYRCSVNDPIKHDLHHVNKFYKIDETELKTIDPFQECLNRDFYAEAKAFNETCLMIRQPSVEIINYVKKLDLTLPAYRFVLYGTENGTGKRSTLLHLLHYCHKDNWLVVHIPNASGVLRKAKESQPSSYKEGRLDTPLDAALFLKRFSIQNMKLLKELNLCTTKKYTWSNRDSSPEGTALLELIDYANSRIKYSSDICGAILREIKSQSSKFKVFVVIEGLNSYFGPTRLKRADKTEYKVDDVTIVRNFKKLLKNDWTNAVVVGTIGSTGVIIPAPNRRTKFYDVSIPIANRRRVETSLHYEGPLTPAHLLKKEGFYYMEPFIPIEVPAYSDLELTNHYEYYKERNWLQNEDALTDDGREELKFLCGNNPREFMRVCQTI